MKVCFVVGNLGRGGAEKQLVFMLRALKSAEIKTRVLCLTSGEPYEAEIRALGIEVKLVSNSPNRLIRLWRIIENLRQEPADLVQSSHFYTNIYAALAGRCLSIPSIGAIRNNLTSEIEIHNYLGKFQVSLPHFLIANSALAFDNAVKFGISPDKIEFVRNAIEIVESDERRQYEISKPAVTLLFVGRLSPQKRVDRFIRLAKALIEKFPALPLRFQIVGDGILREQLEKQAKDALLGKIEFLGMRTRMNQIYRQADMLVLTSDYEGTPNVVLEAMSNRLPVIATNVGGTAEIINEKCGFLTAPGDEQSLIKAASSLIDNAELRRNMGLEGFRYVKNNHSLDNLKNHLISIYLRLILPAESKKLFRHNLA